MPQTTSGTLCVLLVEDDVSDVALMEDAFSVLADRAELFICEDSPALLSSRR